MGRINGREQPVDDVEIAGAIDPRGLDDLVGHREQRLPHEEGAERAGRRRGEPAPPHRVDQVSAPSRVKTGTKVTCAGMSRHASTSAKATPRPAKLSLASA